MSGQTPKAEEARRNWTQQDGDMLQDAVDRIFVPTGGDKGTLGAIGFSLTIADPSLEDCPLIGSSTGFCTLCGYEMHEIVGRNCRFLIDPVPKHLINDDARKSAREFCAAARDGRVYKLNTDGEKAWMPEGRPSDYGVFCSQTNMRKDGTLFKNMFYMRSVNLNDHVYILGLQSELRDALDQDGREKASAVELYYRACRMLEENMAEVERILASKFWYSGPMRRQDDKDNSDGFCLAEGQQLVWSGMEQPGPYGAAVRNKAIASGAMQHGGGTPPASAKSRGSGWSCCYGASTVDTGAHVPYAQAEPAPAAQNSPKAWGGQP